MTHLERLQLVANEYWQPSDVQDAARWAVERIAEPESIVATAADRIHAQSELLTKRACNYPAAETPVE